MVRNPSTAIVEILQTGNFHLVTEINTRRFLQLNSNKLIIVGFSKKKCTTLILLGDTQKSAIETNQKLIELRMMFYIVN